MTPRCLVRSSSFFGESMDTEDIKLTMNFNDFRKKVGKQYTHIDYPIYENGNAAVSNYFKELNQPEKVIVHRFLPFIRQEIEFRKYPKWDSGKKRENIKVRPVSLASHRDTGIYALYADKLNTIYNDYSKEMGFSESAVAYRTNIQISNEPISNITIAKNVFNFIDQQSDTWIIKGDFKGFFDNLNHNIINRNVNRLLDYYGIVNTDDWNIVLKNIEKYRHIEKDELISALKKEGIYRTDNKAYFYSRREFGEFIKTHKELLSKKNTRGIPQGTSISAVLANVYMMEFDQKVIGMCEPYNGEYYRYSDDFIVVLPKKRMSYDEFIGLEKSIRTLSKICVELEIEEHKTKKLVSNEGYFVDLNTGKKTHLDYLGFVYSDNTITLRSKSIYKFYYRGRKKIAESEMYYQTGKIMEKKPNLSEKEIFLLQKNLNFKNAQPRMNKLSLNRIGIIKNELSQRDVKKMYKKNYRKYIIKSEFTRPRESFISYANKADEIFSTNSEKYGYKVRIKQQMNRQRRKMQEIKHEAKNLYKTNNTTFE